MRILASGTAVAVAVAMIGLAGPVSASEGSVQRVVNVTENAAGAVHLSSTRFHEGVVKFNVSTTNPHGGAITLFQLNKGVTMAKAVADVKEEFSSNPKIAAKGTRDLNRDITFYGLADVTPGHPASVTERLYDGTYYAADVTTSGLVPKNVATIKVLEGGDEHARLDTDGLATVTLTSADRFAVKGHLPAKGSVLVKNAGDSIHFMQFQPVKPGTTDAQVQAFFDAGFQGPAPFTNGPTVAMDVLSVGHQLVLGYNLPKGTYVLLCFVADDMTGMPHAFMGMHKVVTLG